MGSGVSFLNFFLHHRISDKISSTLHSWATFLATSNISRVGMYKLK
jgi:hypothetical protein